MTSNDRLGVVCACARAAPGRKGVIIVGVWTPFFNTNFSYTSFLLVGFIAAIWFRSLVDLGESLLIFLGVLSLIITVISLLSKERRLYLLALSLIVGAVIGIARYEHKDVSNSVVVPDASFEAVVISEPERKERYTRVVVEERDLGQRVLLTLPHYPSYKYGDLLNVSGEIQIPGEGNKVVLDNDFDWGNYLAREEIYFEMYYPKTSVVAHGQGSYIKQKLFDLKQLYLGKLKRVISEPAASFLGGLTVGAKESMGEQLLEDFRRVGLIHIVVLSGYNIMIVAETITRVFSYIPFISQVTSLWLGILGIVSFALLVGGGPTVIRASIMAVLALVARITGRTNDVTRALVIAAAIMIFHNPKVLVFDVGFQLSFIATVGLIYISPIIESFKSVKRVPETVLRFFPLREIIATTVAAQIAVLPWILYKFGFLSIISLFANVVVLPLVPITMLLGFLTGVAGFISTTISLPFAWLSYLFLWFELRVVEVLAALPFAAVNVEKPGLLIVTLAYVLIAYYVYKKTYEFS